MSKEQPGNSKTRAALTEEQAIEIFKVRLQNETTTCGRVKAVTVANMYGVNEKTVRDIWNGRTWKKQTDSLLAKSEASIDGSAAGGHKDSSFPPT
jgi:hypothetical protein